MPFPSNWPQWPPPSHGLETERRLTTLEIRQADHSETIEDHGVKHSAQDVWNKAFTLALMGLGSGLAHAKAGEVMEALQVFLKVFRP